MSLCFKLLYGGCMTNKDLVQKCLHAYGDAIRNDWSSVDGRTVRDDLDGIAAMLHEDSLVPTFEEWLDITGIVENKSGTYSWL
jgi:hypothetical protein